MASTASPKRMVSSVFITLAPPYRATVTQQQSALQAHSTATRDPQRTATQVGAGDDVRFTRPQRGDHSQAKSLQGPDSRGRPGTGSSAKASHLQSSQPTEVGPNKGTPQRQNKQDKESVPLPPVAAAVAALPSSPRTPPFGQSTFQPCAPDQTSQSHYLTPELQPGQRTEETTSSPATRYNQDNLSNVEQKNIQDTSNQDVCGFCRKPVPLSEPAIEALNRTYHGSCFQCRSCHIALAGQEYYNKAGIPLCADCYQASLEICWSCGEPITDHIIRALERAYHPPCFTCTTCKQQIGEQPFAQGEVGEVYCLEDYYRKYAPKCNACNKLIIPKEDGTDSYNVECLGHSYHEYCYRCQVCGIQLSPEPNERGCYPLDGKLLCKSCHLNLISSEGHNY